MAKGTHIDKELLRILQKAAKDPAVFNAFLIDLLTEKEVEEINTRWQIVCMLADGVPQREIAKKLSIGIATVTRGSHELSNQKGGFRIMLKRK